MTALHADWRLVDLVREHAKECASDHCSACDCGWMGPDTSESGLDDHAEHVAIVIQVAGYARADHDTRNPEADEE